MRERHHSLIASRPILLPAALLMGALLFFPGLDNISLRETAETRASAIARGMATSGQWIVPRLGDEPIFTKPSLFHWMAGLSLSTFDFTEGAARLPSATLALAGVAATYFVGEALLGPTGGFLSAVVLITSPQYLRLSRMATVDMTLAFTVTLTLALFFVGIRGKRPLLLPSFLFLGLGTLAKGPVGAVLPGGIALLFTILTRGFRELRRLHLVAGLSIFLITALPWYILIHLETGGEFTRFFLLKQNIEHIYVPAPAKPLWFYIPEVIIGFFPWSLFLPFTIGFFFREGPAGLRRNSALPIIWFAFGFLLFSAVINKRADYIVPLYPALALIVGVPFAASVGGWGDEKRFRIPFITFASVALLVLIVTGPLLALTGADPKGLQSFLRMEPASRSYCAATSWLKAVAGARPWIWAASGVGVVLLVIPWLFRDRARVFAVFGAVAGTMVVVSLIMIHAILPGYDRLTAPKNLYAKISSLLRPGEQLSTYRLNNPGVHFYLPGLVNPLPWGSDPSQLGSKSDSRFLLVYEKEGRAILSRPGSPYLLAEYYPTCERKPLMLLVRDEPEPGGPESR